MVVPEVIAPRVSRCLRIPHETSIGIHWYNISEELRPLRDGLETTSDVVSAAHKNINSGVCAPAGAYLTIKQGRIEMSASTTTRQRSVVTAIHG